MVCLITEDSQNSLKFYDSDYVASYVVSIFFYILFIAKLQRATFLTSLAVTPEKSGLYEASVLQMFR